MLNKRKLDGEQERILVLRYSSLGDVILTNPVLDCLRRAYPKAKIFFATKAPLAPAVCFHPAISGMVLLTGRGFFPFLSHGLVLRALKPTVVLDLHHSLRTWWIRFFLYPVKFLVYEKEALQRRLIVKKIQLAPSRPTVLKYLDTLKWLGISPSEPVRCRVHVSKMGRRAAQDYLRHYARKNQRIIGLGPGATWATKQWPADYYAQLASGLVKKQKAHLLWFGNEKEIALIRQIQARMTVSEDKRGECVAGGKWTLENSASLIGLCHHFIGNDSGLVHLASGRGVPVTVIYGSTTPSLGFEPWGPHNVAQVQGLHCRPCDAHGKKACPLGHFKCMKNLTPIFVENSIHRFLAEK